MSRTLQHECTRVPITALAECGPLCIVAEGPYLRFYRRQDNVFISSKRLFEAQAIHGICELSYSVGQVHLIVWGGPLVRALTLRIISNQANGIPLLDVQCSEPARAPDWILDLHPAPNPPGDTCTRRCAAVTAHNALLDITLDARNQDESTQSPQLIAVSELTSSSRSILYSAHLLWESKERILVAAGTAFGEIIYWSWDQSRADESKSIIHRVFLGHEGSVFGVQISNKICLEHQEWKRLLVSCSDDRTIRMWDVSGVTTEEGPASLDGDLELQRTRHTGFSNSSFDNDVSNKDCVAIGWGHTSRVWKVEFLNSDLSLDKILLLSVGEDATSRTWRLPTNINKEPTPPDLQSWRLELVDTASYHNGKNVWSMVTPGTRSFDPFITLGGADSKITKFGLRVSSPRSSNCSLTTQQSQYEVEFFAPSPLPTEDSSGVPQTPGHRSSKQMEFLRSYAFLDGSSFILTTNSGKVYLETLSSVYNAQIEQSRLVAEVEDLSGYSVCAGTHSLGAAFVAGAKGSLYAYTNDVPRFRKLYTANGKIGEVFISYFADSLQSKRVVLLVTLLGQKVAQFLDVDLSGSEGPTVLRTSIVPIPDQVTGLTITSMTHIETSNQRYVLLGYRRGPIAVYRIAEQHDEHSATGLAELLRAIEFTHGKETVTAMGWVSGDANTSFGHLVSTGRDGCVAVHLIDLANNFIQLVHYIALPVGPNIEGLYIQDNELHVYGFSNKEFIIYNTATEEVIMSVETGGAHRSWAFQRNLSSHRGGTLVWTRASSMHIRTQTGLNHDVIRSGGHGREIKAVAVSPAINTNEDKKQLIATGAEDTDIKVFQYSDKHLTCLRTLRKHTTGIQSLQWSADGSYLFSSGGCEEFYVWKIRCLPSELGAIGVVCEGSCPPESEHSDLRIMAFDAKQQSEDEFVISMVFSNSTVKVYMYNATQPDKWHKLASGLYFTSCLTQCAFLPSGEDKLAQTILTAGTDGHAVLWPVVGPSTQEWKPITYRYPVAFHQSSSKTLAIRALPKEDGKTLLVSGGDDGTLAFLLTSCTRSNGVEWAGHPVVVLRAHASAVTACEMLTHDDRTFVVTSGNDQWVRLWELVLSVENDVEDRKDWIEIQRTGRIKTSVADVSSMAVLASEEDKNAGRVLISGVGMEVIKVEWEGIVNL